MVEIGHIPPFRSAWPAKKGEKVTEKSSVGKERDQHPQRGQKKTGEQDESSGEEKPHFDGYA